MNRRPPPVDDGIEAHVLRRFRREQLGRTFTAVCFLLAVVLVTWQAGPGQCRRSIAGRTDIRAGIVVGVDAGLTEGGVRPGDRDRIGGAVERAVAGRIPDPDCWPGPTWIP